MSVDITNVTVLDNPTSFTNPMQFEITFECVAPLSDDLEFKVIYVGSANSESHDQVLDSILVGPIPVGVNKFVFQVDPPDPSRIPREDVLGVTVALITCSYKDQEFVRIGYYVSNSLSSMEGVTWTETAYGDYRGDASDNNGKGSTSEGDGNGGGNDNGDVAPMTNGEDEDFIYWNDSKAAMQSMTLDASFTNYSEIMREVLADAPRITKFIIDWN